MGQTHDLRATVAKTLPDTVLIGTIRVGNCNFSVPDSDGIGAPFGADRKFLRRIQIQNGDEVPVTDDLRPGSRFPAAGKQHQKKAQREKGTDEYRPKSAFQVVSPHMGTAVSMPGFRVKKYSKKKLKTQEIQ